ncbi:TIGR02186 family protein [Paralimibaculum aggregatum]|uniref:TIGR02186 family protein n=1 Tax=Paralimibaculum aggregatum TaxID=3036245 RepID=A0ABQ6LES7_9RHOB|nr:TIGR02186 family protein [Limibaculum sp. NKW23]GMG81841.1 TIGR02186 family protein [Limibaculum sp. NKW23]
MIRLAAFLLALVAAWPAAAEEVVAALNQTRVAITTSFDGSEIFIYGAIKRDAPEAEGELNVVITLIGPSAPVVVRKKIRQFGIWVNDPGVQVDAAPSFYAVASTRPLREALSYTDDLRHRISIDHAVRLIGDTQAERYPEDYRAAVMRLRRQGGLYTEQSGAVSVAEATLFSTSIRLPAQLIEGDYRARIFITRDKAVVDHVEKTIAVRKIGLERWIYVMAKDHALIYGLLSLAIALAAGWLASTFFRIFFP